MEAPKYLRFKGAVYRIATPVKLTLVKQFSEGDRLYQTDLPVGINAFDHEDDYNSSTEYIRVTVSRPRDWIVIDAVPAEQDGTVREDSSASWGDYYRPGSRVSGDWKEVEGKTDKELLDHYVKEVLPKRLWVAEGW